MPLLVNALRWGCLLTLVFWGSIGFPAQALQAMLQERVPLCDQPRQNCSPLFFLNKGEHVQVIYLQGKDWLRVQHIASQRMGWVSAQQAKLLLPTRLQKQSQQNLSAMLGFWALGESAGVFSRTAQYDLSTQASRPFAMGYAFAASDPVIAVEKPAGETLLFHRLEAIEQHFVLWEVNPFLQVPQFRNLARFERKQDFVGSAQLGALTLIAGKAQGLWGEGVLLALDSEGWPVWIYRDLRELWAVLPFELQSQLKAESFKLLRLSPEGHVLLEAYNTKQAKKVILHWRYDKTWVYQQMLQWPAALKADAVQRWFVTASAEALVLAVNEAQQAHLFLFPAGLSEMAVHEVLPRPLNGLKWFQDELWSLDVAALTRWKPVYTEAKK